jgi:hypothetical protein
MARWGVGFTILELSQLGLYNLNQLDEVNPMVKRML